MMPWPLVVVLMPVTTTWMAPLVLVAIDLTYFETWTFVLDSQPQLPATGRVDEDWVVSVTLVRQAEAARIASDILPRAVKCWYAGNASASTIPMNATAIISPIKVKPFLTASLARHL